ncbi:thioesterase family protein [Gordonia sp. ABSL1-1]|uniref:thioesterase family protein n=1 Tax=Gordonia sp. ABSL1-1 TaxID=3053923 RepID=UPI0025741240|nr:thioesterase family protein [Gordonia sp. ABSL1-1]MDL9936122.1 thioesterase family protein [Gordonia sp. ABSL1-1]
MASKLDEVRALTEIGRTGADQVTYRAVIDPVFTIGPKVHGGSLQMIVARAARRALADLTPADDPRASDAVTKIPVAISSDYLVAPDAAEIDFVVTIRKRGRTVTVLTVDAVQQGRTVVSSSVTMAHADSGPSHHSSPSVLDDSPVEPPADGISVEGSPIADVIHLGPALDMVLDPATFPLVRGEKGEPVVIGWVRPKEAEPDIEFAVLVGDISPPVVMNLAIFGWAPTVQLTTYLRRHPAPGWLRFAASSTEVGPGMFEEDHLVVDSTGAVVAQTRQLALIPAAQ